MSFAEQLILDLLPIVVPVLVAMLAYVVRAAIERLPSNRRDFVAKVVQTAVTAAEQANGDISNGPTKKQEVLRDVMLTLSHFHMAVPESFVSQLIEETVHAINQSKNAAVIVNEQAPLSSQPPRG